MLGTGAHDRREPKFLASILEGDRRGAEELARQVFEADGVRVLYEDVVTPALRQTGELWCSGHITMAEEHLATATVETAIAALYPRLTKHEGGPRAIVGCVQGERHSLGARMFADLLAIDGWSERLLGADVPVDELVRTIRFVTPRLVALSVTIPAHVPAAREAVASLRQAFPAMKLLVGGAGAPAASRELEASGADAVAMSLFGGVEIARDWKVATSRPEVSRR
jgi:methanogenic corrinoid protein MtbC1